jgi:hypothetical protein
MEPLRILLLGKDFQLLYFSSNCRNPVCSDKQIAFPIDSSSGLDLCRFLIICHYGVIKTHLMQKSLEKSQGPLLFIIKLIILKMMDSFVKKSLDP